MPTQANRSDIHKERRIFLDRCLKWIGTAICLVLIYPLLRFLGYRIPSKPRYVTIAAPLPISGYHAGRDFILFTDPAQPFAVSRTCTHLGCRVSYLEDKQIIECPCHQSRFTRHGKVLHGPAKRDLPTLAVEIRKKNDGTIKNYVVTL